MRIAILSVCLAALSFNALAQVANDACSNALFLCPGVAYQADNYGTSVNSCAGCEDGATSAGNFCFQVDNSVWFSFATNVNGGSASLLIDGIACLAGTTNGLQAIVIQAGSPCDESTYTAVSACNAGQSGGYTLPLAGLLPSTLYYVQIDGDEGSGAVGECEFQISVQGPAVDPVIQISSNPSVCNGSTGSIDVISVSPGIGPYQYALNGGTYQAGSLFSNLAPGGYTINVIDQNGCVFQTQRAVPFVDAPNAGITTTSIASCNGSDGTIELVGSNGGTPPYSFSLNGGGFQPSPQFAGLPSGAYQVIVQDANGCEDTVQVSLAGTQAMTDANVMVNDASCGGSDGVISITPVGGFPDYSYSLNGGPSQLANTFSGLISGSYQVVIADQNGCTYIVEGIQVSEGPPNEVLDITLLADPIVLCDGQNFNAEVAISGAFSSATVNFTLNESSVQSGGLLSYTGTASNGDTLSVLIGAQGNCLAVTFYQTSNVVLTVLPNETGSVNISSNVTEACRGEAVQFVAESNGCTQPQITWYFNGLAQTGLNNDTINLPFTQDVNVYAEVVCQNACSQPAQSNAIALDIQQVSADAGEDQVILQGASTQLEGSGTGTTFAWTNAETLTDPSIADPVATPEETTAYILTVTNGNCTATDTVIIYVTPPIIPTTVITPNGDGLNETWYIQYIENYPSCRVDVYDRWGQRIFNSIGYQNANAWDGAARGMKLPAGTYYYVIELNTGADEDVDVFTGAISIIY